MELTTFKLLQRLWSFISKKRRLQFFFLVAIMILVSFAEVISIGAVIPFLTVLADPVLIFESSYAKPLLLILGIAKPFELVFPLTLSFILAILFAGSMRILLTFVSTKLSFATGADIGADIYQKTLHQPYSEHALSNSSEVINSIVRKTDLIIQSVILQVTTLISAFFFLVIILSVLVAVYPQMALSLFTGFALIYFLIITLTKRRLLSNGKEVAEKTNHVMKNLQESLGGIKDVILNGSQKNFYDLFRTADVTLRKAQADTTIIVSTPKFAIESLGMVLIALFALYYSSNTEGLALIIPLLGALALGAQRLLPILQQGYAALSSLRGSQVILMDVLEFLEREYKILKDHEQEDIIFQDRIDIENVGFKHSNSNQALFHNINLSIPRGSTVGFIGKTGSGKTTLLDLFMGLLEPTSGLIKIDDTQLRRTNLRAWQKKISHVPQNIFLSDATIAENVAFGVPEKSIDKIKVNEVLEKACLSDYIDSLPNKIDTVIGERGARLSGGQKQRLGIARSLYKDIDIIVFDEATSSLDSETESKVMEEIASLDDNLTLLIIAHRVSTLRSCDFIINLSSSGLEVLQYSDIKDLQDD